ncbi:MAG: sigma 54-interacting transcriptional regulator [Myxococcaceae bacterium]
MNLSRTGMGLVASPHSEGEGPREGDRIEVEFPLPDGGGRLRAKAEVRWRHDAGGSFQGATTGFGLSFVSFDEGGQVRLAHYLSGHQVTVAVAYADPQDADALAQALEGHVQLRACAAPIEVEEALSRGDTSALVVCGDDEYAALALVELVAAVSDSHLTFEGRPRDLAPRVVFCAKAAPERLIALFNSGKLFRALPQPINGEAMRDAVLEACRDRGMRLERERMALELERNLQRERAAREPPPGRPTEGPSLESPAMRGVMELLRVAAPHKVAVLLQGETGSGKEVLARATHRLSPRREGAFVVQDCGTLTDALLESELFGHVKGAFTGAVSDHPGLFVLADGGTVFLDEIENTTPNLQAKLLRVLETGEVRPVGGTQVRQVDVRLVAASNRDLAEEVRSGRFRSDLFYRLNTFTIDVPPLRERKEDLLALARYFLEVHARVLGRAVAGLAPETEEALLAYQWPGNARELRNVMERAVILVRPGERVGLAELPPTLKPPTSGRASSVPEGALKQELERVERELIRAALERAGGVLRRAARELHADPVTLGRRARKLGVWPLPALQTRSP